MYYGSWYGCQTWEMYSKYASRLHIAWNKAVRRTLRVPYTTHTRLLPLLVQGRSFADQHASRIEVRVLKFILSFINSKNHHIAFIGKRALQFTTGALGRNRARCELTYGSLVPQADAVRTSNAQSPELWATAQSIRELIDARDNIVSLHGFTYDDMCHMITSLCCM